MNDWILMLGGYIDGITASYVNNVVAQLAVALTPIALSTMTIWWIVIGWAVLRGEVRESVQTLIWKVIKMSMIFVVALNTAVFNDVVADTADGLRDGMANVFGVSIDGVDTTATQATVWTAINNFDLAGGELVTQVAEDTSWYNVPVWVALLLVSFGQGILTLAGLFITVLSKVFQSFFLAVGPLFILSLAFKPTQRFFDGWLAMIVNTIILSWIGLFLTGFGMYLMREFARAVATNWDTLMPITTALQYCGMCAIFTVILFQAPSWAAALAGGSSVQTGISMITQALIVRGRGGAPAAAGTPSGTNVIAGSRDAVGSAARAAGQFVSAGAGSIGRRAAYRLAALRGRR